MSKSFKRLQNSLTQEESDPKITKKKKTLIHGKLVIHIKEAKDLPNLDNVNKLNNTNLTDAFVNILLDNNSVAITNTIIDNLNPKWDEVYYIDVCHFAENIEFIVYDEDSVSNEKCGSVKFKVDDVLSGHKFENEEGYPIKHRLHRHERGRLFLSLQFVSCSQIENGPYEVDGYFSVKNDCRVTLYQDAHVQEANSDNPNIENGSHYSQMETLIRKSCWKDIYESIIEAQQLICITGWSVWHELKLFRGEDEKICNRTLGEILIKKAASGTKVFIMIWDEATTGGTGNVLEKVVTMGTHDEETYDFFKNTAVQCVKVSREDTTERTFMEKGMSGYLNSAFVSTSYSHHQKTIICDAPSTSGTPKDNPRRLVSFVGGLDVTDGRWDTPDHELFSTLTNEHDGDFYQTYANVSSRVGPRQPWHDIHSKLEGSIAYDVFQNFYERWRRQGLPKEAPIFPIDLTIMHLIKNSQLPATENPLADDNCKWTCRLFRSITSDSALFDHPNKLSFRQNKKSEMSIQKAYIHIIRKAKKFIYIENQYFYGSSYMWDTSTKPSCRHTIPFEIARKIANKIRRKDQFVAYIVVPMFPEGDPTSKALQEILWYQRKTIEMMYATIAEALKEINSNASPTDFLYFMCPAKREKEGDHMNLLECPEEIDPISWSLRDNMRCPIYVHSKMMIVDDVYIIVGSANINQRSMAGTRDTEIAVGCRQDEFGLENPFGDIHEFRKSLFTEHFVGWHQEFTDPSTNKCIAKVKKLTIDNWTNYIGPKGCVTDGHMLPYPLHVQNDGKLGEFIGTNGVFPDFGGKIEGKRIALNYIKSHQRVLT